MSPQGRPSRAQRNAILVLFFVPATAFASGGLAPSFFGPQGPPASNTVSSETQMKLNTKYIESAAKKKVTEVQFDSKVSASTEAFLADCALIAGAIGYRGHGVFTTTCWCPGNEQQRPSRWLRVHTSLEFNELAGWHCNVGSRSTLSQPRESKAYLKSAVRIEESTEPVSEKAE